MYAVSLRVLSQTTRLIQSKSRFICRRRIIKSTSVISLNGLTGARLHRSTLSSHPRTGLRKRTKTFSWLTAETAGCKMSVVTRNVQASSTTRGIKLLQHRSNPIQGMRAQTIVRSSQHSSKSSFCKTSYKKKMRSTRRKLKSFFNKF